MKPLKLVLRGINSYREEQCIDFSKLTSYGLFGIFGPTGSGKSSILDAITLALYARLPRSTKNFININEQDAAVSFLFSITTVDTRLYQVERTFRYHNKDQSSTVRNISGRLTDVTGETPQILADRPTEVTQECIRLLGLTSDDFMRTVVLPQGQFSEFLKLKNAERRSMLQRIFHLEKYGQELTQKISAAKQQQELLLSHLEGQLQIFESVTPAAIEETKQQWKETGEKRKQISSEQMEAQKQFQEAEELRLLEEEYEPLTEKYKDFTKRLPTIKEKEEKIEIGKKANQLKPFALQSKRNQKEYEQNSASFTQAEQDLADYQEKFEQLKKECEDATSQFEKTFPILLEKEQRLLTAIDLTNTIQTWKDKREVSKKELTAQHLQFKKLQDQKETEMEKETELKKEIALHEEKTELLKPDIKRQEALEKGNLLEETYREKRQIYEKNKKQLTAQQLQLEEEKNKLQSTQQNLHELYQYCLYFQNRQREQQKKTAENLKQLQEEILNTRQLYEQCQRTHLAETLREGLSDGVPCPVCGSLHHDFSQISSAGQDISHFQRRLTQLEQNEKLQQKELQIQEQNVVLLDMGIQNLETLDIIVSDSETLHGSDKISENDGFHKSQKVSENTVFRDFQEISTSKAFSQYFSLDTPDKLNHRIRDSIAKYSAIKGRYEQLFLHCGQQQEQLNDEYHRLQESGRNILSLRQQWNLDNFTEELKKQRQKEQERQNILELLKEKRLSLESLGQQKEFLSSELLKISEHISSSQKEIASYDAFITEQEQKFPSDIENHPDFHVQLQKIQDEKKKLDEQKNILNKRYQEAVTTLQQKKNFLSSVQSQKQSSYLHAKDSAAILEKQLIKMGFSSDVDLEPFYMPEETLKEEEASIELFKKTLHQTKERLQYLEEKLDKRHMTKEQWQHRKDTLERLTEELEQLTQSHTILEHRLSVLQEQMAQKNKLETEFHAAAHKRGLIRHLEQLFKGNAFIEYVAQSKLKYIAIEASAILQQISGGSYALEINDATEFIIRDNKNGGILRPCDTLSGGETFITSLSLALALSSAIQLNGTAPLELFFLDEGFGSLDDELLDVVMTSLERLQNKKRSIGIITHVEAVRARVPIKLLVTPSDISQNGSTIRMDYS